MSPPAKILSKLVKREALPTSQLVELLASPNKALKQLTADYVAYAHHTTGREDLSLLVTNLLLRDARDPNPQVSGAAVAALASLSSSPDTALQAIFLALDSQHAQVRRKAAAACVRFGQSHPDVACAAGLTDRLYGSLRDTDPLVVSNCLVALDHILQAEGGVVINRNIVKYLFSRLSEFSSSSLESVLTLCRRYSPRDDQERFELLNHLDSCFQTDSPAVLAAAVELFLHWTELYPHLKTDLARLVQPSLCRMFVSSGPEVCSLLSELLPLLGDATKLVFSHHYSYFALNSSDPLYLKRKKFEIFELLALPENVLELISEVHPYCSDFDSYRYAIKCLAKLGAVNDIALNRVFAILPELLAAPSEKIIAASLECLLFLASCKPERPSTCGNRSTANVLSDLSFEANSVPVGDTSTKCDTVVTVSSASTGLTDMPDESNLNTEDHFDAPIPPDSLMPLSETVLSSVSLALSKPSLVDQHGSLVLHTLSLLCSQLDCCITCLEQLHARHDSLTVEQQCLLLSTAARLFLRRPTQSYVILCRVLQQGLGAQCEEVRQHTALVYAVLRQGPRATAQLLALS